MNNIKNIIIQAGGLGSRLLNHTKNKPKCLVPLNGKPLIQYSLEKFKNCNIIIIGDYKFDVLENYINTFYKDYNINLVKANGKNTCAGINEALKFINNDDSIAIMWSDLILEEDITHNDEIQIFITDSFECRYKIENNKIFKKNSNSNGIVGLFTFKNKSLLSTVPDSGSFVGEWLINLNNKSITPIKINKIREIGTLETLQKNTQNKNLISRFFNRVEIKNDKIYKNCIDYKFQNLIDDEKNWYKYVIKKKYEKIPKVFSYSPLTLEFISGFQCHKNVFNKEEQQKILVNFSNSLKELHSLEVIQSNNEDVNEVYYSKTFDRVEKIKNLLPFIKEEKIKINNKININPFNDKNINYFSNTIKNIKVDYFYPIHGDCTFSNFLVLDDLNIKFIDPRGSFGDTKIFGDKNYDWAKFYYSLIGNYDSINSKNYNLDIDNDSIEYNLKSSGWEHLEDLFFSLCGVKKEEIYLLNCLIWFSLCGYVIEDYDSIFIAFCNGVEYWNKYLEINSQI